MLGESATLEHLLEEISFRRRRDLRRNGDAGEFSVNHNTTYWTDLFVRHFLFQTEYEVDRDDLLFFIRKNLSNPIMSTSLTGRSSLSLTSSQNSSLMVEVYRRDSRKLPIGDPDIDWEETIYLNLIVHQLSYKITLAVCSRTSPKNLQVIKRFSTTVYATPSRRKMECKGDAEEMTYPFVSFTVDNFDEIFENIVVRDGESIGIELTAADHRGKMDELVLFSSSVPYETIKRVYDARASQTVRKRLSQTNLFSLFSGGHKYGTSRVEYVRLVGPQGHAELAVARPKEDYLTIGDNGGYNGGCETPCSEPGTDIFDQVFDSDSETEDAATNFIPFKRTHHRRLSDPSSALNDFMRVGGGLLSATSDKRSDSETNLEAAFGDASCEIYAGDLLDEFEENKYNPLWTMKGYTQIFHSWRESKRVQSLPVGTYVTYVTLPWWSIIKDILDNKAKPLLTF